MATRQLFQKPDGSVVSLDQPDFQAAQDRGYKPYDPAAPKPDYASDHPGEAFGRGLLRTVTLGASDPVLAGMEGGPQASQQLREENPVASPAGELAGFFVPGPGEAAAAKAGEVAEKAVVGIGSKSLSRAARGAAEGGIWGLGSAISENTMGDPGMAGEHYAAGVLGGALAGAGANVVMGKFGDLGKSALIKAFGGKALQDSLSDMAEEQVMKSITLPSDLKRRALKGRVNEVGRFAMDEGFTKGTFGLPPTAETAAERASARASQAAGDVEVGLQAADATGAFKPEKVAQRMQGFIDAMDQNPAVKPIKEQLQKFVDDFAPITQHGTPGHQPPAVLFDATGNPILPPYVPGSPATRITNPEAPVTFEKAWDTVRETLDRVGQLEAKGMKSKLFRLRGELQDEVFQQANALSPGLGDQIQAANRELANSATFKELATKTADQQKYHRSGDLYAAGGLAFGGPVGMVKGLATGMVRDAVRERGGFALASAMDALAQNQTFKRIATAFQKKITSGLDGSPAFGGAFRAVLENAAAEGAQKLMETHLRLAHTEPGYLAQVGMQPEESDTIPDYADKAHRLSAMYQAVDDTSTHVDMSIKRFLGTMPGRAPDFSGRQVSREEFAGVVQKLKALQADSGQIKPALAEVAPTVATAGAMTASAAAKYLLDKAPQDPNENVPMAMRRPWNPGEDELRRWSRCVAAIANPLTVLDAMRAGRVTPEALDAVKAVYPAMFAEFQSKLQEHLAQMTSPLDLQRRMRVEQLLGSADTSEVDALIQNMHAATLSPEKAPDAPDGRQNIDADKNQLTQAQRLEGKNSEEAA